MVRDILSRVGIGSAEVDTILPEDQVAVPGESIDIEIVVEGGNSDQEIEGIYFSTMTQYESGGSYTDTVVDEQQLSDEFVVEAGETRTIETEFHVHRLTPATMGKTKVWVDTGMDIDWAKDPSDRDELEVKPDPYLQAFLDAVENLGFEYETIDCVLAADDAAIPRDYTQEFDVVPSAGSRFEGDVTELDCYPMLMEDGGMLMGVELEFAGRSGRVADHDDFSFDVNLGQVGDVESDEVLVTWEYHTTDVSTIEDQVTEIIEVHT